MMNGFLRFLFVSHAVEDGPISVVDEVPEPIMGGATAEDLVERRARVRIVVLISWVLALMLGTGFVYVLAATVIRPGLPIPEIVSNLLWAIIGYFGGALTAFLGSRPTSPSGRSVGTSA
jgi:hypothetical protein